MFNSSNFCCLVVISVILWTSLTEGAPRSKLQARNKPISSTMYDQKQTGEYNIQLHLKDFQIIAVVGEDSLGMGDYDYNYDYSEFTVKPQVNTTTAKPTDFDSIAVLANSTSPNENPTNLALTTTKKPFMHQHFPTTTKKPSKPTKTTSTTPKTQMTTKAPAQIIEDPLIINNKPTSTETIPTTTIKLIELTSTLNSSSDKIPVAIQDYFTGGFDEVIGSNLRKNDDMKKATNNDLIQRQPVTNVAIVPSEEIGGMFEDDPELSEQITLGEIMQYRRCALGYIRDKRGRCRKIRRPAGATQAGQLPLGITRFASNIAARFRQATSSPADNLLQLQQQDYNSSSESNEPSIHIDSDIAAVP